MVLIHYKYHVSNLIPLSIGDKFKLENNFAIIKNLKHGKNLMAIFSTTFIRLV